ncbi:D-alanyl-D-alanine carboxypeptidase [Pseudorhodobacter turbinis]|uniref:D-alanyl-D-alanine carboxypeptidase n=2 Tax=Pseudorhodobacter turbinis TaxID=2500533 RepID=A0A4P8EGR1_9RHOB|nr:D-alanyl-D-alanine carboxypeptidase family protein [Pseudorhodobacter turbinis]QCO56341.1 D-alanyl-D-alanine carboxypeptidase [Pseudorhodobacter turbinis]
MSVRSGQAAPYAAVVIDARSGEMLYDQNADARLHPASLTKMLTLYIAFDAVRRGEVSLDTQITVSKNAASKPPSKLGLRAGQRIALRYLIRAAAVKSANDAASAIGDHLGGSEAGFAARMNRTAKALGMRNSTFKNANGLTASGHLSTARDMTLLGRRLFYDFPEYYNIFSRLQTDAGMTTVRNTNRRFLNDYKGADGIKTGYTSAAGFNLTASAERGNKRIIATIFGGKSTADRNAKMAKLLDLGFGDAKNNVAVRKPAPANLDAAIAAAETQGNGDGRSAGKTIRLVTVLKTSPRPRSRPVSEERVAATAEAVLAMQEDIAGLLAEVAAPLPQPVPAAAIEAAIAMARPEPRPDTIAAPSEDVEVALGASPAPTAITETSMALVNPAAVIESTPRKRPARLLVASAEPAKTAPQAPPVVVTRVSTSGGRHWGVNLGRFPSRSSAERVLMKTALSESVSLRDGLRKVIERRGGYDANFMGLSRDQADLACRRLQARAVQCFTIGP